MFDDRNYAFSYTYNSNTLNSTLIINKHVGITFTAQLFFLMIMKLHEKFPGLEYLFTSSPNWVH